MKFGLFYEHQIPRPWVKESEHQLFQNALKQVELADQLGFDYVWEVEHHFLEEYSHSSAPEVFLGACSQRTKQIRMGHGIILHPPAYNHPARIAERLATLDLVSNGRVDWGTGESASRIELEAFGLDPTKKRDMWTESVRETAKMMTQDPYQGYQGTYFSMPPRNVVPKPLQKPHPPIWIACSSRETIKFAAKNGIGALTFAFVDPEEAKNWVDDYYHVFETECEPIGQTVNPNVAMVTGFSCHEDEQTALKRGLEGFRFFQFALAHYYINGSHIPGQTNIWQNFQKQKSSSQKNNRGGLGTPAQLREHLEKFETAGVDQVIFLQQAGNNQHSDICDSLKLFSDLVMPDFKKREKILAEQKALRLAPAIRKALERVPPNSQFDPPLVDSYPILKQKAQQNNKTEMNTEQPALDPKWQAAIEGGDRR